MLDFTNISCGLLLLLVVTGCAPDQTKETGRYQVVPFSQQLGKTSTTVLLISDTQSGETKVLGYVRARDGVRETSRFWLGKGFSEIPFGPEAEGFAKEAFDDASAPAASKPAKDFSPSK